MRLHLLDHLVEVHSRFEVISVLGAFAYNYFNGHIMRAYRGFLGEA